MTLLAYTPFIDPLDIHSLWFVLIVPISIFIAIGYKAVRCPDMSRFAHQVVVFSIQVIGGIIVLGAASYVFVTMLLPALAPMPGS